MNSPKKDRFEPIKIIRVQLSKAGAELKRFVGRREEAGSTTLKLKGTK